MFYASANQFREFGHAITEQNIRRKGRKRSVERETRRFKAFFGIKAERASEVWSLLLGHNLMPPKAEPEHLLWALLFLKLYCIEEVLVTLLGRDDGTIRKWVWLMVEAMHNLSKKLVRFQLNLGRHILNFAFSRSNGAIGWTGRQTLFITSRWMELIVRYVS
jgi:hypothetical protein